MSARLVIRADATPETGAGHVMRAATLAEAWVGAGLGTARVCGNVSLAFAARRVLDAGALLFATLDACADADVLVVDSYDAAVRERARAVCEGVLVIVDDVGDPVPAGADVIWNPNPYGRADLYPGYDGRLLTGDRCVPIRPGLPAWSADRCAGTAVALGGSVLPDALRAAVIASLAAPDQAPVVGAGSWVPSDWEAADADAPWGRLASCCRVVVGAGTSAWEAAAIGIPAVVVGFVPNQRLALAWARAAGAATVDLTGAGRGVSPASLREGLGSARPLPALRSGAAYVAGQLHQVTTERARS